jgi:hypothetical protein
MHCGLPPDLHDPFPECPEPARPPERVEHCGLCGSTDISDADPYFTVDGIYHHVMLRVCEGCRARPIEELVDYMRTAAETSPFPPI